MKQLERKDRTKKNVFVRCQNIEDTQKIYIVGKKKRRQRFGSRVHLHPLCKKKLKNFSEYQKIQKKKIYIRKFCVSTKSFAVRRHFLWSVQKRQKHVPYKVILYCANLSFLYSSQKMSFHHEFFCAIVK